MSTTHRIDVHQHVVPAFWAKELPTHGGDPSGTVVPQWSREKRDRLHGLPRDRDRDPLADGASGMGAYHGHEGFKTMSHAKGVFEQGRLNFADAVRPPFGRIFERTFDFLLRKSRSAGQ